MSTQNWDQVLIVDSGLDCDMFNVICCDGAASISSVQNAIDHFRKKKLPYAFWVGFENEPKWLEKQLEDFGLITDEMEWAMVCDLNRYDQKIELKDFEIKQVSNQQSIVDIVETMKAIFPENEHGAITTFFAAATPALTNEHSQLLFFVGYENNVPVGISSLFVEEEIASIFDVIVVPEARGRGYGKLMTQYAALEAKNRESTGVF